MIQDKRSMFHKLSAAYMTNRYTKQGIVTWKARYNCSKSVHERSSLEEE